MLAIFSRHDPKLDNVIVISSLDFYICLPGACDFFRHDPYLHNVCVIRPIDLYVTFWCLKLFQIRAKLMTSIMSKTYVNVSLVADTTKFRMVGCLQVFLDSTPIEISNWFYVTYICIDLSGARKYC